jgi:hypothetical protein
MGHTPTSSLGSGDGRRGVPGGGSSPADGSVLGGSAGGRRSPGGGDEPATQNRRTRGAADSFDAAILGSTKGDGPSPFGPVQLETDAERTIRMGITKFNVKPRDGIQYLGAHAMFDASSPAEVATFLCSRRIFKGRNELQSGLSKKQIGHYLGSKGKSAAAETFHAALRRAFVRRSNFKSVEIDEAMRAWLTTFVLPGEAQVIDRLVHCFAEWWHESNPDVLREVDSAHILAFGIMMLHTDAHSGKVKQNMTREQFSNMLRGTDQGRDPPQEMLARIYARVTSTPFDNSSKALEHDVVTFFNASREGWLWKQGSGRTRKWCRRWFLLNENCLYYFKKKPSAAMQGTEKCRCVIPLESLRVALCDTSTSIDSGGSRGDGDGGGAGNSSSGRKRTSKSASLFQLESSRGLSVRIKSAKRNNKGQLVRGTHRRMVFRAPSAENAREWVQCIQMEMAPSPMLLMLQMQRMGVVEADSENTDVSPISSSSSSAMSSASALTPLSERNPAFLDGQAATRRASAGGGSALKIGFRLADLSVKVGDGVDGRGGGVGGDDVDDRMRQDGELVTDSETSAPEDDEREMRDHLDSLDEMEDSSSDEEGGRVFDQEEDEKEGVSVGAETRDLLSEMEATKGLIDIEENGESEGAIIVEGAGPCEKGSILKEGDEEVGEKEGEEGEEGEEKVEEGEGEAEEEDGGGEEEGDEEEERHEMTKKTTKTTKTTKTKKTTKKEGMSFSPIVESLPATSDYAEAKENNDEIQTSAERGDMRSDSGRAESSTTSSDDRPTFSPVSSVCRGSPGSPSSNGSAGSPSADVGTLLLLGTSFASNMHISSSSSSSGGGGGNNISNSGSSSSKHDPGKRK